MVISLGCSRKVQQRERRKVMPHKDPEKNRAYCREYHKEHYEEIKRRKADPARQALIRALNKRRYERRRAQGLCTSCGKCEPLAERTLCEPCAEKQVTSQRKSLAKL